MVCRMNLWRIILGSGGRAVFTKPFCSCSHKVLTIRLPKPTKNGWTCLFKAMHWPNWRTENSGEKRYLHLSCSGKGIRAEFCSIKCTDLTLRRKQIQGTRSKVFSKPWEIQKLSNIWKSVDLFLHCPCGPAVGWHRRPGKTTREKFMEAEGACERPDAMEYLSVYCNILLQILGSPVIYNMLYVNRTSI